MSDRFETISKRELLQRIQAERLELEATLDRLTPAQYLQPGLESGWCIKDILAHLTAWETNMQRWTAQILRGEPPDRPASFTDAILQQINQKVYLENRNRDLEDVLADFRETHPRTLELLAVLTEQDLVDPHRFPTRQGIPLWMMVAANTWWHYKEHRETIQAWLASQA